MLDREHPPDYRRKDVKWQIHNQASVPTMEGAMMAVLMDLRDELKEIKLLVKLHTEQFGAVGADIININRDVCRAVLDLAPKPAAKKRASKARR